MKIHCKTCGQDLPRSAYPKSGGKKCKACVREYVREWRKNKRTAKVKPAPKAAPKVLPEVPAVPSPIPVPVPSDGSHYIGGPPTNAVAMPIAEVCGLTWDQFQELNGEPLGKFEYINFYSLPDQEWYSGRRKRGGGVRVAVCDEEVE